MTKTVIRFPNSKRKLTLEEEQVVQRCANLVEHTYMDANPFVSAEQRAIQAQGLIRECIKRIFEINEDKQ